MELTSRACRSTSAASVSVMWNELLTFNRIMVASEGNTQDALEKTCLCVVVQGSARPRRSDL